MPDQNVPDEGAQLSRRQVLAALTATTAIVGLPVSALALDATADQAAFDPAEVLPIPRAGELDIALKPNGMAYLWATEGLPDADGYAPAVDNLADLWGQGWRFVPVTRHPEMAATPNPFGGLSAVVRAAGCNVLMERSQALQDAAVRAHEEKGKQHFVDAVSAQMAHNDYLRERNDHVLPADDGNWTHIGGAVFTAGFGPYHFGEIGKDPPESERSRQRYEQRKINPRASA